MANPKEILQAALPPITVKKGHSQAEQAAAMGKKSISQRLREGASRAAGATYNAAILGDPEKAKKSYRDIKETILGKKEGEDNGKP